MAVLCAGLDSPDTDYSTKLADSMHTHAYDLERANATCVNEADFDSEFVQSILAADASVFDVADDS